MSSKVLLLFVIVCCKVYQSIGGKVTITVPSFTAESKIVVNATNPRASNFWQVSTVTDHPLSTCTVVPTDVADSYFVMQYINTDPAEEVTISVQYRLSCCTPTIVFRFSIGLYVYHSPSKLPSYPNPNTVPYTYIGELRNTSVMQGTSKILFNSQKVIGMKGTNGLYVAFRDRGICGTVESIDMHYYDCPQRGGQLVTFDHANAPNSSTAVLRVNGKCAPNSEPENMTGGESFMLCYPNGTAAVYGGCNCLPGYRNLSLSACTECLPKSFKDKAGNFPCKTCGANVVDGKLPRITICECMKGFYRPTASKHVYYVDCEEPPSEPRNLNAIHINSTWALIEWIAPSKIGTGDTVEYEIKYGSKVYTTRNLRYNVTGLATFASHNVTVLSVNNVTRAIGISKGKTISFKTSSGLPSEVQNLILKRNADASVTVSWKEPSSKGGDDLQYFVVVNGDNGRFTRKLNHTVYQKQSAMTYTISIKSHTSAGFSPEKTITFSIQGKPEGIPLTLGIGIGSGLFVIIIIAIILVIVFYRRRHPKHLQPVRLENGEVILPNLSSGARVYIDPTTYNDVEDAVQEFANELERSWIELERLIGGGEFGDVYRGLLRKPKGEPKIVAVKTLKTNADRKARNDFLGEAAYMGQFDDPNVISIEGVIVKDRPVMIVIDFMSNGSLDSFLQDNDGKLSALQLLGMARGVSSGMTYLAEMMFIHRDLAARNILVDENMVCKVADFGMSRELQSEEETYNTTGGKIPVRWTAPEAIQYKKFTVASDVWSYGVLLWEIMSFGERPYWDWGNYEVLERLASGYRLPPPMSCPKVVHDLMLSCWRKDRVKRPKFREIRETIDKWIRSPDLLKMEGSVVTKRDENLDYASMKTLKEWLDSIGLGHYIEKFSERGLVTPRQILELSDADLKDLGIAAVGHRNKIMKSINTTKGQLVRTKSLAI